MEFQFRVKYDSGTREFHGLDMYYGAHSLAALSEVILIASHAAIHGEVILQAPAARGFRVVMQRSYAGSLEQIIQMYVTDPTTLALITDLGKSALIDMLKYLIGGCVGIPYALSRRKARKKMLALMRANDDLHSRLEKSMMRAHLPVKNQGYDVTLSIGRTVIATFNAETLNYLETEEVAPDTEVLALAVSRLNARTGTGRFIDSIDAPSHGFSPLYDVDSYQKEIMATSLTAVTQGSFEPVNAIVTRVTSSRGVLKRYQLHGVSEA